MFAQDEYQNSNGGFTQNAGQLLNTEGTVATEPKFYSKHGSEYYYLESDGISYSLSTVDIDNNEETLYRFNLKFKDATPVEELQTGEQLYYKNYYLPHANDLTNVGVYNEVSYAGLWENINLKCRMTNGINYLFELAPEANTDLLQFSFEGINAIETDAEANIYIGCNAGAVFLGKAEAYQEINGNRERVDVVPNINGADLSFNLGSYDNSQTLFFVIGPLPITNNSTLQHWSTFINGGSSDINYDVFFDANNNLYACGQTSSSNYPQMTGQFNSYTLNGDAYVYKFNPSRGITWGSYFGGSNVDYALHVAANAAGYVYIAGNTTSTNMPMCATCSASTELQDATFNGAVDLYIAKFNNLGRMGPTHSGTFASYFGGSGDEELHGMTIDNTGNLYLGGVVFQPSFPTFPVKNLAGAYNRAHNLIPDGANNGFISKINSSNTLTWSTAIGGYNQPVGNTNEEITGMTTDASGNLYVTGTCGSSGTFLTPPVTTSPAAFFPLADPAGSTDFCRDLSGGTNPDAHVMKFNAAGAIVWSTLFGGTGTENFYDYAHNNNAIAVDAAGNIFITGTTRSTVAGPNAPDFPYKPLTGTNKYNQPTFGGGVDDAFIAKFSPQFELLWSTYYGGTGSDFGLGVAVSPSNNNLYFTGGTTSSNFPLKNTSGSYNQPTLKGGGDAYLLKFNTDADRQYAMYYGGSGGASSFGNEVGKSVATDADGSNVFICGTSLSNDFPWKDLAGTADYFYGANAGGGDAFISNLKNICVPCIRLPYQPMITNGEILPQVYPNPTTQYLQINFNDATLFENVTIINGKGQTVKQYKQTGKQIFVNDLPAGIYNLRFTTNGIERGLKFSVAQ